MINFVKAQKSFKEYLSKYNLENGSIKLKIKHTYEVVNMSEYIAKSLGLNEENIELAKIIALLHDIGRFEQISKFAKFDDTQIEHAKFGVRVLFEDGLIRKFVEDEKYDNIIRKAIYNHNKLNIEQNLNNEELLHSKIIRDSDKIDNFRVKKYDKFEDMFPKIYNKDTIYFEQISQKVYEDFLKHKCINLKDRITIIDYWVCVIGFLFDLNFEVSFIYVKENNYIDELIDRIEYKNSDTKQKMEDIRKCAKEYIERKCNIE